MKDRPKCRKRIRDNRGFTLAELLITVGIVVILCALGTIAIFRIQKNLRQKELDSKAEIIYEAAQNQITKLKTAGDLTAYQSTDHGAVVIPSGEIQDYLEETDFVVDGQNGSAQVKDVFCYVTSQSLGDPSSTAVSLLPRYAVDEELRGHEWIIEYDATSGSVFAVFYSEKISAGNYTTTGWNYLRDKDNRLSDGAQIGYYGGDATDITVVDELKPTVSIHNGERLTATFKCKNIKEHMGDLSFEITFRDEAGHTYTKTLQKTDIKPIGQNYEYVWVLDDLNDTRTTFHAQFPTLDAGTRLTVTLTARSTNAHVRAGSDTQITNSLFGYDVNGSISEKGVAYIDCGRHLQNLHNASGVAASVTSAVQSSNLYFSEQGAPESAEETWYEVYADRKFTPIVNNNLISYDGSCEKDSDDGDSTSEKKVYYNKIYGLRTAQAEHAGLFGMFENQTGKTRKITLKNIRLSGTYVTGTQTAGTIIGSCGTDVTIEGCMVYLTRKNGDLEVGERARITAKTAGGLIGEVKGSVNVNITDSFTATVIGTDSKTEISGGLIGKAGSGTDAPKIEILRSYADDYLQGNNAGGLIGSSGTTAKNTVISSSYAVGFIGYRRAAGDGTAEEESHNLTAAGLVNGVAKITDSYAAIRYQVPGTAEVYTTAKNDSSLDNVYYLGSGLEGRATRLGTEQTFDQLSTMNDAGLGGHGHFVRGGSGTTYPYEFRTDLTSYPYPRLALLESNAEKALEKAHYGDWQAGFVEGQLVYYEKYGSIYGFSGAEGVESTLLSQAATGDGYGLIFEKQPTENVTISYETSAGTMSSVTLQASSAVEDHTGNYYILPFTKEMSNPQAKADYYYQVMIGGHSYFYNPHFARTVVRSDEAPDEGSLALVEIRTARQLYNLSLYYPVYADYTSDVKFLQENDIEYPHYEWTAFTNAGSTVTAQEPIGNQGTSTTDFVAEYDGNYHTITGVSFVTQSGSYAGLFGYNQGYLHNIVVTTDYTDSASALRVKRNAYIQGGSTSCSMGVLAGFNGSSGRISNCAVAGYYLSGSEGTIYAQNNGTLYAGGLVGGNQGAISNCSADCPRISIATSFATAYVGGFAGRNFGSGTISNCYALGRINVISARSGLVQIAGFAASNSGRINNSYCATALIASGSAQSYGFAPAGGTASGCTYLNGGTYEYVGELSSYNNEEGVGTSLLMSDMPAYPSAVNSYNYGNTNTDNGEDYPFKAVVVNEDGRVHYGDWVSEVDLGNVGLFYWEHETTGTNQGYKLSYVGSNETVLYKGSSLCVSHDDDGCITEYGYGYYASTDDIDRTSISSSDIAFPNGAINSEASEELAREMPGYSFVAFNTGDKKLHMQNEKRNGAVEITYESLDGGIFTYPFVISPFFADAIQYTGQMDANDRAAIGAYANEPGTADNEYEVRGIAQLQYINWNHQTQNTTQVVSASNYQNFPYLTAATVTGQGSQSYADATRNRPVQYWKQTHDLHEDGYTEFTPIAGAGTSSTSGYNAVLYAWFGGEYDGQSYTIKNINIDSDCFTVGLFGVTAGAHLENIILYSDEDSTIVRSTSSSDPAGGYALGGLVGIAYDYLNTAGGYRSQNIINCAIAGYQIIDDSHNTQTLGEANVGGLVGISALNLERCSSVVDIMVQATHTGHATYGDFIRVGGLCGANKGTIRDSYSGGSIEVADGTRAENGPTDSSGRHNSAQATHVFVGGISGSAFAMNYQNFTNKPSVDDNTPYFYNCYTYCNLPEIGGSIRAVSLIGSVADRYGFAAGPYVYNCYYLEGCVSEETPQVEEYRFYGSYGGGTQTNAHSYSASLNYTVSGKTVKGSYYSALLVGDFTYLRERLSNGGGEIRSYGVDLTKVSYDELSSGDMPGRLGGNWGNVTTIDAGGAAVDGRYSFPGSNYSLEGKNYPFPTVVTQPDLSYSGVTVDVHYGEWTVNGLIWEKGVDSMDIFKDMQEDGDAVQEFSFRYATDEQTSPHFTFGYGSNLTESENEEDPVHIEEGTEETSHIVEVLDDTVTYDDTTDTYSVKIKALQTGAEVVVVSDGNYSASFTLSVTADLNVRMQANEIIQKAGDTTEAFRIYAESNPYEDGSPENATTDVTTNNFTNSKANWSLSNVVEGLTTYDHVSINREANTFTVDIESNDKGEDVLTATCEYHYYDKTYVASGYVNIYSGDVHEVTYVDSLDVTHVYETAEMVEGHTIQAPMNTPVKDSDIESVTLYTFAYWSHDPEGTAPWDFDTDVVMEDTKIYAIWSESTGCLVSFDTAGAGSVESQVVAAGETAEQPSAPARSGWTFKGWFADDQFLTSFDFNDPIMDDTEIYAGYTVKVTFISNGGSNVQTQDAYVGLTFEAPNDPTRNGYHFKGWFADEELTQAYDFSEPVADTMTLWADWVKCYTVTYNDGAGTPYPTETVEEGDTATYRDGRGRAGKIFEGWYLDSQYKTEFDFATEIRGNDLTLYGKYLNERKLKFDANGGTGTMEDVKFAEGEDVEVPDCDFERSGYEFDYWTYNNTDYEPGDILTGLKTDATLKAQWDQLPTVAIVTATRRSSSSYTYVVDYYVGGDEDATYSVTFSKSEDVKSLLGLTSTSGLTWSGSGSSTRYFYFAAAVNDQPDVFELYYETRGTMQWDYTEHTVELENMTGVERITGSNLQNIEILCGDVIVVEPW